MTIWDDRILEIARKKDSVSPKALDESGYFDISKTQISRRCRKLNKKGLLQHLGNGVYIITDRGMGYLDGEISTIEGEPDEVPQTDDSNNSVPSPSSPESP